MADAADILEYLSEAIDEHQLAPFIQYQQKVISANWQSDKGLWSVRVEDGRTAQIRTVECRWLFSAGGYYRYDQGFSPGSKAANSSRARSSIRNTGRKTSTTPASASWSLAVAQLR